MTAAHGLVGRAPADTRTPPENLRLALEELGPTFIKLGQLLSTRADLLSPDYRAELIKLQDTAPAVPSEVVAGNRRARASCAGGHGVCHL